MAEYSYKMFNADLTCTRGRGKFQYQPDVWYEEEEANCARNGFHSAKNPLDCLDYYGSFEGNQCWICEIAGDIDEDEKDSKVSSTRIRLVRRLSKAEYVAEAVKYILKNPRMPLNGRVMRSKAEAGGDGWAIACGPEAMAMGRKIGDVIGVIRTDADGRAMKAGAFEIDGVDYRPDCFYDASGAALVMEEPFNPYRRA